jgi:CubicO group peptidase (beta-lactamase class C family)
MVVSRRDFMLGSAGLVVAATRARMAWPVQGDSATPDPRWQPNAELLRHLPRLLELASVPGLGMAVVDGGRVWIRGFGQAIEETSKSVSDQTVFEAASLGKPVFALRGAAPGGSESTRSGPHPLPLSPHSGCRQSQDEAGDRPSRAESHQGLPNWRRQPGPLEPATEPGKHFSYSGEAYFYLQRVVEAVSGTPFPRLMREQVFDRLGMKETSYVWLASFESRMAAGYDSKETRLDVQSVIGQRTLAIAQSWGKDLNDWRYEDAARAVQLINPQWPIIPLYIAPNAASTLLTTTIDYAKFLSRVVAPSGSPGLELSPTMLQAMTTPQVRLNSALWWGLGWGIQRDEYGQVLWQWGANNSFRNFVIADQVNSRAVVVFTNSENGPRVYERVIVAGHRARPSSLPLDLNSK